MIGSEYVNSTRPFLEQVKSSECVAGRRLLVGGGLTWRRVLRVDLSLARSNWRRREQIDMSW